MGARRAGYITSLIVMILGIIMIPLGLIFMTGGIYDGMMTGEAGMFAGGIVLLGAGILMFIIGLPLSIALKRSGNDNINITFSAQDGRLIDAQEPNPILKMDRIEPLDDMSARKQLGESETLKPQYQDAQDDTSQNQDKKPTVKTISLQDMVMDLQEAERGDKGRLDYIAKRLASGRTIYDSDNEYVQKQFTRLRAEITKEKSSNQS